MTHLTLIHEDNFDIDGPINPLNWKPQSMRDGLHLSGNGGIDRNGDPGWGVKGKRWSAWYDRYHSELAYCEDGKLYLGAKAVQEKDPTRIDYERNGIPQYYSEWRLYSIWIDSWSRGWDGETSTVRTEPDSPNILFNPGTYFEISVNFSEMCVPGHRFSCWLMPANDAANKAYNDDPHDGIEVDLFEFDCANPNVLLCKCVGGQAGDTTNGVVDLRDFDIDISQGDHVIGLKWTRDALVWTVDAIEVQRDEERSPHVTGYLVLSREMNSGVKPESEAQANYDAVAIPPYIPVDPGLFGISVIDSLQCFPKDKAIVNYLRAYSVNPGKLRSTQR